MVNCIYCDSDNITKLDERLKKTTYKCNTCNKWWYIERGTATTFNPENMETYKKQLKKEKVILTNWLDEIKAKIKMFEEYKKLK